MLKKLFGVIAVCCCAVFAAEIDLATTGEASLAMPQGNIIFKCVDNALQVNVECQSEVLPALKRKYATLQWNVWEGESVDLTFSPYGGWPGYRLRLNPSGKFFQSFNGEPKWISPYFKAKATFTENGWLASFTLPFAALETDINAGTEKPSRQVLPSVKWNMAISRRAMNAQGKVDVLVPEGVKPSSLTECLKLKLAANGIAPYRATALCSVKAIPLSMAGAGNVSGRVCPAKDAKASFTGKLLLYLHVDEDVSKIAECEYKVEAGAESSFSLPAKVEETGGKLSFHVELLDAEGKLVHVSRFLNVENPWAE